MSSENLKKVDSLSHAKAYAKAGLLYDEALKYIPKEDTFNKKD